MTKRTIKFLGDNYAEPSTVATDGSTILVGKLSGAELVDLYNLVSSNLGRGRVKRFADTKTGVKRTWAILQEYDAQLETPRPTNQAHGMEPPTVQLTPEDKAQVADEAASRGGYQSALPALQPKQSPKRSDVLLAQLAATGAKNQAQADLRSRPAPGDAAKAAEMPALRKAAKALSLAPKKKVYARKAGSKQAVLVDMLSRPQGATFSELYDALAAVGKPWKGVTIRSGLAWDINHIAGYGVQSEMLNGEQFMDETIASKGEVDRSYEAMRLGLDCDGFVDNVESWSKQPGYDPDLKLAVYRLTYPTGMDAPLPHIGQPKA
jgi:hypothetical protein